VGDIGKPAHAFLETLTQMKLGVWQFLPTGPTAYGDSPYQPLSAFAGNENLIGIDPLIQAGLLQSGETAGLQELPANTVDYGRMIPAKRALLNQAADRFFDTVCSKVRGAFDEFLEQNDAAWLDDYALFRILKTHHGERPWPEWEKPYVYRESVALGALRSEAARDIERIKIQQFLFDRQWQALHGRARELGVSLFSDMPIYIALDSADAWASPELLLIDRDGCPSHVAGVPPDYFSEDGQLWGNPLYDWEYHARTGYQWWIDRLRHAARMSDLVRVDHFRGFEAYWSIPADSKTARNGSWVPGPGFGLFDALKLAMGELPIVAEDLGVITPEVDALRHRYRIPGMVVLQFEVADPEFRLEAIDENSVCYTGTHDNDTTQGWFEGGHGDTRSPEEVAATREAALRLTGATPETVHLGMIRLAFGSPSRLAIAPMQDYLGLGTEARLNIPGTTQDNWRWRVLEDQLDDECRARVANMVSAASRG
jgi:4-alpha-glucanotransferase